MSPVSHITIAGPWQILESKEHKYVAKPDGLRELGKHLEGREYIVIPILGKPGQGKSTFLSFLVAAQQLYFKSATNTQAVETATEGVYAALRPADSLCSKNVLFLDFQGLDSRSSDGNPAAQFPFTLSLALGNLTGLFTRASGREAVDQSIRRALIDGVYGLLVMYNSTENQALKRRIADVVRAGFHFCLIAGDVDEPFRTVTEGWKNDAKSKNIKSLDEYFLKMILEFRDWEMERSRQFLRTTVFELYKATENPHLLSIHLSQNTPLKDIWNNTNLRPEYRKQLQDFLRKVSEPSNIPSFQNREFCEIVQALCDPSLWELLNNGVQVRDLNSLSSIIANMEVAQFKSWLQANETSTLDFRVNSSSTFSVFRRAREAESRIKELLSFWTATNQFELLQNTGSEIKRLIDTLKEQRRQRHEARLHQLCRTTIEMLEPLWTRKSMQRNPPSGQEFTKSLLEYYIFRNHFEIEVFLPPILKVITQHWRTTSEGLDEDESLLKRELETTLRLCISGWKEAQKHLHPRQYQDESILRKRILGKVLSLN